MRLCRVRREHEREADSPRRRASRWRSEAPAKGLSDDVLEPAVLDGGAQLQLPDQVGRQLEGRLDEGHTAMLLETWVPGFLGRGGQRLPGRRVVGSLPCLTG